MAIDTVVTFDDLLRQQGKTPSNGASSSQGNTTFKASDYYNFSPGTGMNWSSANPQGSLSMQGNKNIDDYLSRVKQNVNTSVSDYYDQSYPMKNKTSASTWYDRYANGEISLDEYINNINHTYGSYNDADTTAPNVNNSWKSMGGAASTGGGYTGGYGSPGGSYNSGYDSGYQDQMAGIQDYLDSMMASYQQAYEAQLSAIRQAQAAQERARREALGYAQGSVNQNSDEALRQAYIQARKAQRDMPQQLAAQGISGGLSESTAASLQNQYGENRNELEQARQQALAQLASDYAAGTATDASGYNMQIANILGNQAQQNAALQQWGFEQMLAARQNALGRAGSSAGSGSREYYNDEEFPTIAQQVITGQLSANDLRNMSGSIISRLGIDGYEYLMEQAQGGTNGGFAFNDTAGGFTGPYTSLGPLDLLANIQAMARNY